MAGKKQLIDLHINGERHEVAIESHWTLLDVVREQVGLTGSKPGCDVGDCGSCTMLIDGRPELSCIQLAIEAVGKKILTIEGVADHGKLHPLQKQYNEWGAAQCGYCNPGIILSVLPLLDKTLEPTRDQIKHALASNLCRCTGYTKIITAVEKAAAEMRQQSPAQDKSRRTQPVGKK